MKPEQKYTQSQVQTFDLNGQTKTFCDTLSTIQTLSCFSLIFSLVLQVANVSSSRRYFSGCLLQSSIDSVRSVLATTKYPNRPSSEPPKDWTFVHTLQANAVKVLCKTYYLVTQRKVLRAT